MEQEQKNGKKIELDAMYSALDQRDFVSFYAFEKNPRHRSLFLVALIIGLLFILLRDRGIPPWVTFGGLIVMVVLLFWIWRQKSHASKAVKGDWFVKNRMRLITLDDRGITERDVEDELEEMDDLTAEAVSETGIMADKREGGSGNETVAEAVGAAGAAGAHGDAPAVGTVGAAEAVGAVGAAEVAGEAEAVGAAEVAGEAEAVGAAGAETSEIAGDGAAADTAADDVGIGEGTRSRRILRRGKWGDFPDAYESARHFYVFIKEAEAFVLQKSRMTEAGIDEVRIFLMDKMNERFVSRK